MALPTAQKSWSAGMLVNQRITFVSLLTTLGTFVVGITNQALAKGYTCVGSSNGVTAAMDATNRCTAAAGFAVRAANTTTAQSWIVISDGVTQTLFTFTGASDDVARVSFSPGSLFVVAGTATFAPTATDERVISSASSLVDSTASADRVFTVWIDSTHRMWRAAIFRAGILVGRLLGVEIYDASPLISPATAPVPVWGFAQANTSISAPSTLAGAFSASSQGGVCKTVMNSVAVNTDLGGTYEFWSNSGSVEDNIQNEAQGGNYAIKPIGLHSTTTSSRGKIGNRYDWYHSSEFQACGALTVAKDWVFINNQPATGAGGGVLWPWDGTTATCVTS